MQDITFSEEIVQRLSRHRVATLQKQGRLDAAMQKLVAQRSAFEGEAWRILTEVVLPRLHATGRHLDHAEVRGPKAGNLSCVFHLTPTERFPATVTLTFSAEPADNHQKLSLRYSLEIFLKFIEYERQDSQQLPWSADPQDGIGRWVEEKLLRFLDTYLELETHPLCQKEDHRPGLRDVSSPRRRSQAASGVTGGRSTSAHRSAGTTP